MLGHRLQHPRQHLVKPPVLNGGLSFLFCNTVNSLLVHGVSWLRMYSNGNQETAAQAPQLPEDSHNERNQKGNMAQDIRVTLSEDKEELKNGRAWMKLDVGATNQQVTETAAREEDRDSAYIPKNGFFSPHDGSHGGLETPKSAASDDGAPLALPEKDQVLELSHSQIEPTSTDTNGVAHTPIENSNTSARSISESSRRPSTISSMVFVVTALETIAASKEARKRKGLGESVQNALSAIKSGISPDPELIYEPLRLATETSNIPLTTTALDCIGKLITYSYFSMPTNVQEPLTIPEQPQAPLIERAIDTICDCFQDEATPAEVQLQIVKSLLAAVLNDKIVVHGAGLLKAVRQIYNIFLISKSSANQQVAQGTLTQMVGTVFERVKVRLVMKEARLNIGKLSSERETANGSQVDIHNDNAVSDSIEHEAGADADMSSEGASTFISDHLVSKEPDEKLTLQSFENAKNFDDTRIGDNAPTMVTRVNVGAKGQRNSSGRQTYDEPPGHEVSEEEDEDEIYVKDAFLVFRSMCRLSTKILPQEQLQDLKSQNMRSKLVSLAIIRTLLNNNMDVFTSPIVTIRSSVNNEPTSFGQAINQYLRLSLSRNGASSVRQVFETSCEIFWLMLKDMRVMLKVYYGDVHNESYS